MKKLRSDQVMEGLAVAALLAACTVWIAGAVQGGTVWTALSALLAVGGAVLSVHMFRCAHRRFKAQEEALCELREKLERSEANAEQAAVGTRKEMEAFRSALSHSLRMPISIIQGYAVLLANGMVADVEMQKDYLRKISQRAQYLADTIRRNRPNDVLDRNTVVYSRVDLVNLVSLAVKDMMSAAAERQVTFQVISQEGSLEVFADDYLLNRVVFNLLENAVKYMGRPGTVSIRVLRRGDLATLMVQDDGMGLQEEEAKFVFERDFQGSNRLGGQGYGLYLVKQTAQAHGGTVEASSALGRGMKITFTIPIDGRPD